MASEVALKGCKALVAPALILDPMAGSGTVLRYATEQGHRAVGFDLDPLSVLLARVWTTPIDTDLLRKTACEAAGRARQLEEREVSLPWIDEDTETRNFVAYWFGPKQRKQLRALAYEFAGTRGPTANAMRVAFSRLVITKEPKASLARDTSHSRPHRVVNETDFDVIGGFEKSVEWLAQRLEQQVPPGNCRVQIGDARALNKVEDDSVDAVICSPPYLNAIDYMRGHRLSLVWFGHQIGALRSTRSKLIGTERGPEEETAALVSGLVRSIEPQRGFSPRLYRIAERYADDMFRVVSEIKRVLRPGSPATLVIGNSTVEGSFVRNDELIRSAAKAVGLRVTSTRKRHLPPSRRYLPPPSEGTASALDGRMRTEVVLKLKKLAA